MLILELLSKEAGILCRQYTLSDVSAYNFTDTNKMYIIMIMTTNIFPWQGQIVYTMKRITVLLACQIYVIYNHNNDYITITNYNDAWYKTMTYTTDVPVPHLL